MECACATLSSLASPPLQQFSTSFHNLHDFRNKVIEYKVWVLIFSTNFVRNISQCKKKLAIYDQKCVFEFMYSTPYNCQILIKLEFSRPVFERYTNIKFHENPSSESRIIPCGRTVMMKPIVAFRSPAKAPKKHRFVDTVLRNAVHVNGQWLYNNVNLASICGENHLQHTYCNIRHEMAANL